MKIISVLLLLLFFSSSYSQKLPSDGEILKIIFGKVDTNSSSYTRPVKGGELSWDNQVRYKIMHKTFTQLENKPMLIVVAKAMTGFVEGHFFGYINFYFMEKHNMNYVMSDSLVTSEASPLHEEEKYQVIDIGKQRKGLIITYKDTMYDYVSINKEIFELGIGIMNPIGNFDIEFSKIGGDNDCEVDYYRSKTKFIKNNNGCGWYDIRVHRLEYGFTKGCKKMYVKKRLKMIYAYDGKGYVEKNDHSPIE